MSRRVAVLVKRFPKLSETFIFGEIASLVDSGLDIQIVSLNRPNETVQQSNADRFADRVTYLEPKSRLRAFVGIMAAVSRNISSAPFVFRHLFRSGVNISELLALLETCKELDVAHLHAHYISEPALLADLTCSLRGGTFSVSAHAKDIYLTDPASVRARLKNAAFTSTCTAHNYQYLLGLSEGDPSKIHVVYHGVNSDLFKPAERPAVKETPLIVAIGRFKEKKGFDLLISACASLLTDGVDLQCQIIGYGDQQQRLQKLISDNGLTNHVQLKAPVNHDELVGILQNASLCVIPCRQTKDGDRDGIPNALLEAMSCAVPVVSTTVSGIPEVIRSGTNGILVEPEDVLALARAMRSVLDDAGLQKRLASSGRRTVRQDFSWQANTSVLGHLLANLALKTSCQVES